VLPGLAHRTVRCATGPCPVHHRTVFGAPGRIDLKLFNFVFLRRSSAIIHRTVRWATGLSGAPAEHGYLRATVDSDREQCNIVIAAEVIAVGQRGTGLSGAA
jgi:hypothetical protein